MKPQRLFFGCPVEPADSAPLAASEVRQAAGILLPKPCPVRLRRFGGAGDGAYLLPDDLDGIAACFSPGVNNAKAFEDDLTDTLGIACHLCDRSSDPSRFATPLRPRQTFRKVWLDAQDGPDSVTLERWIAELAPDPADDLILQMDIEGAEYRTLLAAPDAVMRRFRVIVLELHSLEALGDAAVFRSVMAPLLAKLDATHVSVHAHPNNCCGALPVAGAGFSVPRVLEVTFLRRDRFPPGAPLIEPSLPHPLDIAGNVPRRLPLRLDEAWLGRPPRDAERVVLLEHQLAHARGRHSEDAAEAASIVAAASEAAERLAAERLAGRTFVAEGLVDVAADKPVLIGPPGPNGLRRGRPVACREPAFVDTGIALAPSITVDLGERFELHGLVLRNRTDRFQDRARHLFYELHDTPERREGRGIPISVPPGFRDGSAPVLEIPLLPEVARCVTIFSPARTALHFADLKILARPLPAAISEPGRPT